MKQYYSTKKAEPENTGPLKFIGSPAASWQAKQGRAGVLNPQDTPWFQPFIVVGCVAAFLLYFCVFREEKYVKNIQLLLIL